jgi:hypothetical protein
MMLKGIQVRLNRTIGFRDSDPARDVDLRGQPVPSNYVAFVRIKDCRLFERDGRRTYDATAARSIPVNHGATYYGYGKRRAHRGGYETIAVYMAHKGFVYTGTIRHRREVA